MRHTIVMGVCGCGKTTLATALAEALNGRFIEADDLHSAANVEKMRSGVPLNDTDRWPWLLQVATVANELSEPAFISCSALRRNYRDYLRDNINLPVDFVHLQGEKQALLLRMNTRSGHYMPASLLDSQLQLLENLQQDESGVAIDIELSVTEMVARYKHFNTGLQHN